jgi:hypothetical protein
VLGELVCKLAPSEHDDDDKSSGAGGSSETASAAASSAAASGDASDAQAASSLAPSSLESQLDYLNAQFVKFGGKSKKSTPGSMSRSLV